MENGRKRRRYSGAFDNQSVREKAEWQREFAEEETPKDDSCTGLKCKKCSTTTKQDCYIGLLHDSINH